MSTITLQPPLGAMRDARTAALAPNPRGALADLYRYAPAEDASNYDSGLLSLLAHGNPRVRPAVSLGQFDNHPGAQVQEHTQALRTMLAAVLSAHGYRAP